MPGVDLMDWSDIIQRMAKSAENTPGLAIMSVNIVIRNRRPVLWVRPKVTLLEPGYKGEELIGYLTNHR